ncbi:hypothetical protein Tco_0987227 [Tanacetum coccineum]
MMFNKTTRTLLMATAMAVVMEMVVVRGCDGGGDDGYDDDAMVMMMMGWRVEESGSGDRIDRVTRVIFGFGQKSSPEKFFGGRRWCPAAVGLAGKYG